MPTIAYILKLVSECLPQATSDGRALDLTLFTNTNTELDLPRRLL